MPKITQHPNPYTREASRHWWMWELIKFNPKVFYIKPGNSTYHSALAIKRVDRDALLDMLKLLNVPQADLNWYSSFSHITNPARAVEDYEVVLVALPIKEERKFRKHLRASSMLQLELQNG